MKNVKVFLLGFLTIVAFAIIAVLSFKTTVPKVEAHRGGGVDGVCGTTKDTCTAGNYENRDDSDTQYKWKCEGTNGGDDAYCSKNKNSVDGACGTEKNTCSAGTFDDKNDSDTQYKWECKGTNGGDDKDCAINKNSVNGVCGTTKNTCTAGTFDDKPDSSTQYKWQCEGTNGGDDVNCAIDKTTPPVDVCKNLDGVQETLPSGMQVSDSVCSCLSGYHQVDNTDFKGEDHLVSFTCQPDETPTQAPSNPGNPGGPGDGRSDGRSDGLSSCPECTQAPKTSGQVLGATTEFAGTGVAQDMIMNVIGAIGSLSTTAGLMLKKRNK